MRDFLRKGGNRQTSRDEADWSALDAILERLFQHTISTAAKLTNLSRLHKLDFGDDGIQRRTDTHQALLPGRTVSETVVLSNLTIATKQPLLTAHNHLNLLPGLKGDWKTDCEFLPGTEKLPRRGTMLDTGSASITVRYTAQSFSKLKDMYVGDSPLNIAGQAQPPTVRLDRGNRGEVNPRFALVPPGDSSRPHYTFFFMLAGLYCPETDTLAALVFLSQRDYDV